MTSLRKPASSLWRGIIISLALGTVFGYTTYEATPWVWQPLELALAIAIGGYVAKALFVRGYKLISVPVNYVGVATRFGDKPTGAFYDAGDHWGFPGVSGAILVDVRHRRIDLIEKFNASAEDTSDVGVDGFMFVKIADPSRAINVENLDESLRELLESRIRLFTVMVSKAENAVKFRDLLSDYLELKPRDVDDPLPPEHQVVKDRLNALPDGYVAQGGIDVLMEKDTAGALKRLAGEWGVTIEEVEVEQFDIPKEIKEAKLKKAAEPALMEAEKIRNKARTEMVKELVDAGVNANTAMNSVDMLLGLGVKKDVKEITITDLEKVADKLGEHVAGIFRQMLARQTS